MKRSHVVLIILCATVLLLGATGESQCESSDDIQRHEQEKILKEATSQTGMPAIVNFRERKLLKMIIELRDQEKLITYVYITDINANLKFIGKAIGYGIPYATQYTNPMKYSSNGITLPQADPNGLFSPAAAEGTWIMLINPATGDPHPVYIEPRVIVSPFPLK
jgi:hypothetical protein